MFRASSPGSLMLLGEYAVLHGQHALVCAIDKRMYVTVTPRDDSKIIVESALGRHETTLSHIEKVSPFQFVLGTLQSLKKHLHQGCHIQIDSEFSSTVGFASSAAVTVATLAALSEWTGLSLSKMELIMRARDIVRDVQGTGSGADVAACVLGGIVLYHMEPLIAEKMPYTFPISVIYSGYKTPTPVAIKQVEEKFASDPDLFSKLMQSINHCTLDGVKALQMKDWKVFGAIMNRQQECMDALGVSTQEINAIIHLLREVPFLTGAKISGSGMGDCVVALGECILDTSCLPLNAEQLKVNMTSEGVRCEKV